MYRERDSAAGGVVWTGTADAAQTHRVVPDGCMDLLWDGARVLVAGPDTAAHFAEWGPERAFVGLRLRPGLGPAVLGVAANEVRDRRVALEDVWPAGEVRRLAEQAALAADPGAPLERAALRRLERGADPVMAAAAALLDAGASVDRVARETGLGPRRLHRRSLVAFGYGPKLLGRILRFHRALAAARAGTPFAAVAAANGYADQAHLAREVRELAGAPLSVLAPHSSGAKRSTQLPSGSRITA
ncbi:helix-turn-helix domain-containing protein [Streptomonospora sp. PA3]|uniref:helix-turn-helix domain-containing protein n=1 Tax=Streptomonospora sp. PA3 TaxID=2607326 RepID=UPI0012DD00F2|nr:helix-turn-helix domain-containing protein [Streptomonospora sp. PA3]MUL44104.1 helix-turn-helix domain-containing protein [Streptomonospora sp. PA3]